MKTFKKIAFVLISVVSLYACNASNADNPSNSAESPETDTATNVTTDLNAPKYNGAVVEPASDTSMIDTLPSK